MAIWIPILIPMMALQTDNNYVVQRYNKFCRYIHDLGGFLLKMAIEG